MVQVLILYLCFDVGNDGCDWSCRFINMQGSHLISGDVCFEVKLQYLQCWIWPNRFSHCSFSLFLPSQYMLCLQGSHECFLTKTIFSTVVNLGGSFKQFYHYNLMWYHTRLSWRKDFHNFWLVIPSRINSLPGLIWKWDKLVE